MPTVSRLCAAASQRPTTNPQGHRRTSWRPSLRSFGCCRLGVGGILGGSCKISRGALSLQGAATLDGVRFHTIPVRSCKNHAKSCAMQDVGASESRAKEGHRDRGQFGDGWVGPYTLINEFHSPTPRAPSADGTSVLAEKGSIHWHCPCSKNAPSGLTVGRPTMLLRHWSARPPSEEVSWHWGLGEKRG